MIYEYLIKDPKMIRIKNGTFPLSATDVEILFFIKKSEEF